ncbi:pilus assembly protein PilO [Jeotgalibacillus salarius]|uniref:Pilus assembly protein PilO n=1 Tax=Jeotgalibacillus salarius TaxID=546023 RepID=A0A4Y8LE65_9BACL|nr:pilus assembly protein PilO [Jeotgalibacillus salarius]TFE01021.1 pilus assembly protein PilO [Jeotgalibacillus salarius]
MNNRFNRTSLLTIALGTVALLLPVILYFLLIYPLNAEVDLKQQQLKNEEQLIEAMLLSRGDGQAVSLESSAELQKQIPVKPLVDQLILELEKAELVSDSMIASIAITEAEVTSLSEVEEAPEQMENPIDTPSEGNASVDEETDEVIVDSDPAPADIQAPSGLYKVLMNLSVTSDSYFEMQQFLNVLEDSNRIMEVEQISFSDDSEQISVNDLSEPLIYTMAVAAFYYPELEELINELPLINAPPPADKNNPLSQFPDLESEEEE